MNNLQIFLKFHTTKQNMPEFHTEKSESHQPVCKSEERAAYVDFCCALSPCLNIVIWNTVCIGFISG